MSWIIADTCLSATVMIVAIVALSAATMVLLAVSRGDRHRNYFGDIPSAQRNPLASESDCTMLGFNLIGQDCELVCPRNQG